MLKLSSKYVLPDANAIELRAFTHGLMPRTVPAMLEHFTTDWAERGVDAWNRIPNHWTSDEEVEVGWWNLPEFLGDSFISPILGAPSGSCILQPNVHWSMQCVLSSPELLQRGTEVVVTEQAFPSVLHSVQAWSNMLDFDVRIVRAAGNGSINHATLCESITSSTALMILSHVGFTTGRLRPQRQLNELSHLAQEHGALFMLDGYHAAATMPVDVVKMGVDLYAGGLLKEASGSSGNAFLYIRPDLSLTPRVSGWFGDAQPFSFDEVPEPHPSVRRRFLGGTTAVAPLYHAVEGLRILLNTGLELVREDSLEKTAFIIEQIKPHDITLHSPAEPGYRSAMVILQVRDAEKLSAYLKARGIYTDSRMDRFLRLAPFIWNGKDELEYACDMLAEALRSGAYHATGIGGRSGPVT